MSKNVKWFVYMESSIKVSREVDTREEGRNSVRGIKEDAKLFGIGRNELKVYLVRKTRVNNTTSWKEDIVR